VGFQNDFNLIPVRTKADAPRSSSQDGRKEFDLSLGERITSVDKLRSWTDQIPFHYEYTAGIAGERFLRGLKDGRILVSECPRCRRSYLPPKMYCVGCFVPLEKYKEVGLEGTVMALTQSCVDFDGRRLRAPRTFVYVTYRGVMGGLVQRAEGKGLKEGSKVTPRFKPASKRSGSMLDFEFVRVT